MIGVLAAEAVTAEWLAGMNCWSNILFPVNDKLFSKGRNDK